MIGRKTCFSCTLLFAFTLCLGETSAHADGAAATRAARLTIAQGTVTVNAPGNTESVPAQVNLPLLAGVQLATGADGQAEVEFEDGSLARLTPNSILSLDNLSVQPNAVFTTSLRLVQGLAYFELRATPQYLYAITAGSDVLTPVENTTVRVNFDEPPATFAVLDGTAHVERQIADSANAGFQADVRAGESLRGDATDATRYFLNQGIAEDSWDQWNEDLDQTEASEATDSTSVRNNYEGAQGYGWSDLDGDGTWYNVPGQGSVWQPQIAADDMNFDPYGDGEWVAYPGAGFIWASAYPWGWTPYRCGTWSFFGGFGWGWAPGVACGGLGWGFFGGGQLVNIGLVPVGYRPVRVPVTGPHPIHPVLPVHTYQPAGPTRPIQYNQRQIAGKTAVAIAPVGNGNSSSTAGASLHRDFPVDSKSHAPVLGLASTSSTAAPTTWPKPQPTVRPTPVSPSAAERPATGTPIYTQPRPDNTQPGPQPARSQTPSPPMERPTQQSAPAQRYTPPASSAPAPAHPTYSPAPAPRPTYSRPPSAPPPAPHPTYSPPPAPPAPHNNPKK